MRIITPLRRRAPFWLLAALLITQALSLALTPQTAQAAISAEPSEEIVYLAEDGAIRVWDLEGNSAIEGSPTIDWSSPSNGWEFITLGDFNNDGDLEIAALRQQGDNFQWAVFDPVVARGSSNPARKTPNGIPWDILYESTPEPGIIKFIEAGNFDNNVPGEEILLGWRDTTNRYHVRAVKAASLDPTGNPTGRNWQQHLQKEFDIPYSQAASGQLNGGGADEVVLLDNDSTVSKMDVFQVDNDFARLDGKNSDNDTYNTVAVGQIIKDGPEEIAVGLSTSRPDKAALVVYEMELKSGVYELASDDDWQWGFAPQPEYVFLADLFGNGDEEVLFTRKYPEGQAGPRLIMRDDWGTDRDRFSDEDPLENSLGEVGEDNGFRPGVGADVDGDGKDEIVLMRNDRIRIYTRPDSSMADNTIVELETQTRSSRKALLAGNLDAVGFVEGPSFGVNMTKIEATVPTGTVSGNYALTVQNIGTPDAVTFNVFPEAGKPWIKVNPTVATTPATINVSFDATGLQVGTYTASITLSSGNMLNSPFTVAVELIVQPATIQTVPNAVSYLNFACTDAVSQGPLTMTLRVGGTAGLNYRAALLAVPAETAAASLEGAATLVDPAITGAEVNSAGDIVIYDAQGNTRTIPTGIPAGLAAGGDVSAAAVLTTAWPIDSAINWVTSVTSDKTSVPSTIQIVMNPSVLGNNYKLTQAVLVLVGDTRAGTPPDNVFLVPVYTMCVSDRALLPMIQSTGQ